MNLNNESIMDSSNEYKMQMYEDNNVKDEDVEQLIQRYESTSTRNTKAWSWIQFICLLTILVNIALFTMGIMDVNNMRSLYSPRYLDINQPEPHLNHQRWAKVFQKLALGKAVKMGFHGGSISFDPHAYHSQLSELLMKTFPIDDRWYVNDTKVHRNETTGKPIHQMISRAAPAMTSDAASLCVSQSFNDEDIDVISLEYAVNDHFSIEFKSADDPVSAFTPTDNIERFARGYLSRDHPPAIMMPLFSFEGTRTAEKDHMKAALHYGIPTVSWSNEYSLEWRTLIGAYAPQFTQANIYRKHDPIHPNKDGHHIMAQLLHSMIVRMYNSYIASNFEDLSYSTALSRRVGPRLSLLDTPRASLPKLLNPAVQWTSSPVSFCRLMFRTFWSSSSPAQPDDANVVAAHGIEYHKGFHPDWKASFRPTNIDDVGQMITFQSPVPFSQAAILFVFRTWNTTWANATVHLSSSTHPGADCTTKPLQFESTWSSQSTQTAAIVVWSAADKDDFKRSTCVRDLMTVTKISTGDFRVAGFYAN